MTILIDPPNAAGHGRLWSHLASDTSYDELHAFARLVGIPERGFDRDHYDVPAEMHDAVVAAGALPVSSRELIDRLVAAGLRRRKSQSLHPRPPGRLLQRPPLLAPGAVVAVVLPAGPVDPGRLATGMAALRSWGLKVRPPVEAEAPEVPWLAASDAARAAQVQAAWLDPDVAAVWCARGGFGSPRILDLLDWRLLRTVDPSWLVGFSDVTALHQAFAAHLGVATAHAPGVAALADAHDATLDAVRSLVFEGAVPDLRGRPVVGGSARGVLVGGNLTMLASSIGTAGCRPAAGGIAVLEDVAEAPYRLDRMLTQLIRSGWFDDVRGIACGDFTDCGDPETVGDLLARRLGTLGVPLVIGLPVGHGVVNMALPLGRSAELDADSGFLRPIP
jgi:muramoyltetrapeptide carboxypeptidase